VEATHHRTLFFHRKKYTSVAVNEVEGSPPPIRRERSTTITAISTHSATVTSFTLTLCALVVLIVYYSQVGTNTPFERFMDSESFGTSFLFTAIGVLARRFLTFLDYGTCPHD